MLRVRGAVRRLSGDMNVKKNFAVEEWSGKREITEKSFYLDGTTVPWLVLTLIVFPFGVHHVIKSELDKSTHTCATPQVRSQGTL